MFKLPPLAMSIEPELSTGAPLTMMVPPLTLAAIRPWFTTATFCGPPKQQGLEPIWPDCPCTTTFGPRVSVVPPLGRRSALQQPLLPKLTVALPLKLSVCVKFTYPYQPLVGLPTRIVPLRVKPSVMFSQPPLMVLPTSSVPLSVTPSSVPEL